MDDLTAGEHQFLPPRSQPGHRTGSDSGRVKSTSLWQTMAHPATVLGVLSSGVIAVGELQRAGAATTLSPLLTQYGVGYPLLIAVGIGGLGLAWLLGRPRTGRQPASVALQLGLWSLPLLLLPPLLSTDAGSYADLGWMVMNGDNPYLTGLGETGSPFAYGRAWRGTTSVYPAPTLQLFGWIVGATGAHWYWSVVALRLLSIAGIGMLLWAIPKLARRVGVDPGLATWLAVANPIVLVHGLGGEHLDLLMVGLIALAAELGARRRGLLLGGLVLGLAMSIKQPALLAVPVVAALAIPEAKRTWLRLIAGCAAVGSLAVATFAGLSLASGLGFGWLDGSGNPANGSPTLTPAYLLAQFTGMELDTWTAWLQWAAAGVVVVAFLRWGRTDPLRFLAVAALAWAFGFGVLREWYLIFGLAFLPLARPGRVARALTWVAVPAWALYGTWREYQHTSQLESGEHALVWGLCIAAMAAGVWLLTRRSRTSPAKPQQAAELSAPVPSLAGLP